MVGQIPGNNLQGSVSTITSRANQDQGSNNAKGYEIREDFVRNAVSFLTHPKVRTSDKSQQTAFLEKKGLNNREIEEAFTRAELSQKSVATTLNSPSPTVQVVPPTSNIVTSNLNHHGHMLSFREPPRPQPYGQVVVPRRYRWTQVVVVLGMITGTTLFTIAVLRKYTAKWFYHILYKLGLWLTAWAQPYQRITQGASQSPEEEEDTLRHCITSLNKTCETLQTMMETMKMNIDSNRVENLKVEDKLSKMADKWAAIESKMLQGLESTLQAKSSEKSADPSSGQSLGHLSQSSNGLGDSKGNVAIKFPSSKRDHASRANSQVSNALHAPQSSQFHQIMDMVSRGEKIPGVREIDDKPKGINGLTPSSLAPPFKPWENHNSVLSEIKFDTKEFASLPWQVQPKGGKDKVEQMWWLPQEKLPEENSEKASASSSILDTTEGPPANEFDGAQGAEDPKTLNDGKPGESDVNSLKNWVPPPLVSEKPVEQVVPVDLGSAANDVNGSKDSESLPVKHVQTVLT